MIVAFVMGGAAQFYPGETFFGLAYFERFEERGSPLLVPVRRRCRRGDRHLPAGRPRRRFLGAATLVVILVGAVVTNIVEQSRLSESVAAPLHVTLAAITAWSLRPSSWDELRTPIRQTTGP